jgi:hemerythrin-like domain-containing protein
VAKKKTKTRKAAAGSRKAAAGNRKPKAGSRKQAAKATRSRNAARAAASRSARKKGGTKKASTASKAAATVKGTLRNAVAAVTKRLPGTVMDAITLLETDHRRMEDLLKRGEESSGTAVKTRKALLDSIAAELTVHETIEERVLYPALKAYPEARDVVLEGFQEHHVADVIMKELYDTPLADEQWGAKFKVFKENIEHHIDEEEGPMFRTARGVMTREELVALGERMARMKRELTK